MRHLATASIFLAALALAATPGSAPAAVRSVPGSFATIQSAVNASAYGDVVVIDAGTYLENVYLANGVTLQGAGMGETIIDGRAASYTIYVVGGASALTRVLDLTVRNGRAQYGGGIKVENGAQCEIRRCEIVANTSTSKGGGVYVGQNGAPTIAECVIAGNTAKYGGGLYLQTSQSRIEYNVIRDNVATSMGGGIYAAYDRSGIIWNTIDGNSSAGYGAGAVLAQSPVRLHTTIFSNNLGGYGVWTNSAFESMCNDFWQNQSGAIYGQALASSDIVADPLFCDRPGKDFYLNYSSPCVLGPCDEQIGALGPNCGISPPTATEPTSWGSLKGRFGR